MSWLDDIIGSVGSVIPDAPDDFSWWNVAAELLPGLLNTGTEYYGTQLGLEDKERQRAFDAAQNDAKLQNALEIARINASTAGAGAGAAVKAARIKAEVDRQNNFLNALAAMRNSTIQGTQMRNDPFKNLSASLGQTFGGTRGR